jgi:hypothetical protein
MADASAERVRQQMRISGRRPWKLWAAFTFLFLGIFACTLLIGFYLRQTPFGRIRLWHVPLASFIGNIIGACMIAYVISRVARFAIRRYPSLDPAATRVMREMLLTPLVAVIFFATLLLAPVSLSGPREFGIRCARAADSAARTVAQCEVLQTRFFVPNSSVRIPEDNIVGARTNCGPDGRGGCKVDLELNCCGSSRSYPVLSYGHLDQAEASARRLNDYFNDPSRTSIALEHDTRLTLLLFGCGPLAITGLVLGLRLWPRRSAADGGAGSNPAVHS